MSGTVINSVVKRFVSPQGVRVIKLEEVRAFTWKLVAPPVDRQVTVLAVNS